MTQQTKDFYSALYIGGLGSGKTTLALKDIKKDVNSTPDRPYFIFILDINGEFTDPDKVAVLGKGFITSEAETDNEGNVTKTSLDVLKENISKGNKHILVLDGVNDSIAYEPEIAYIEKIGKKLCKTHPNIKFVVLFNEAQEYLNAKNTSKSAMNMTKRPRHLNGRIYATTPAPQDIGTDLRRVVSATYCGCVLDEDGKNIEVNLEMYLKRIGFNIEALKTIKPKSYKFLKLGSNEVR